MGRPVNWVLSGGAAAKCEVGRTLRLSLMATTIIAVVPVLGYGRPAYAACTEIGATAVYECSDTSATETIADDNADVSTLASPPFVVTTGGLAISGNGEISFTDENASSITNTGGTGLDVRSTGNDGGTDGAVTIETNGNITGASYGIYARNDGDGDIDITADGHVIGEDYDGILAVNFGGDLTITTGAGSLIEGDDEGINAQNFGDGDLEITVNGTVTAEGDDAIRASNDGGDLTITTSAQSVVTSYDENGIDARNFGDGDLEITADGQVTADEEHTGIYAVNEGGDLTVTTGADSAVFGGYDGIGAFNIGDGDLEITANGVVTGENENGIRAYNSEDSGNLTVTTGAASAITGDENGIVAYNFGDGNLKITANGEVTGESEDGIRAVNVAGYFYNGNTYQAYDGNGIDLTIITGAQSVVTGYSDGIDADNHGTGDLTITVNGQLTGEDSDGIEAFNDDDAGDLTITTGAGSVITARDDGMDVLNDSDGNLEITVNGQMTTEDGEGIEAENLGANLTITTGVGSSISAGHDGMNVQQYGAGNLEITANGNVEGRGDDGIYARNLSGQNFTVTTGAGTVVTGVDDGIDARHYGEGNFEITANGSVTGTNSNGIEVFNDGEDDTVIKVGDAGFVQGDYSGIRASSADAQDIEITNNGTVRNLSGASDALAIRTFGGATEIENNDTLIGTVILHESALFDDVLDNNGFWNTSDGFNNFGEGIDEVTNTGTLLAADDPTLAESTGLFRLEEFNNDGGLISMVDGQEGDTLSMAGGVTTPIEYTGTNGRLAVDAALGPLGLSDELFIAGSTDGTTLVHVNVTSVTGANTDGIRVIIANDTQEEDFDLDGPLNAGFFTWDLRYDPNQGWHELFSTGFGIGAAEVAAGITGAQEVWHQTTGTLLQRQADLRSLIGGTAVTPVADYAEPVAPTPTAHVTPGFWMRGVGAYIERDDEEDGFILDRKQTVYGGMAGFDFGMEDVSSAWMFGIFGGYLSSDLEFDETDDEWNYEGPTVGAYATYLNDAFHADVTVKADFLDIDIEPAIGDGADTDALNIGGRLDTGYKFGHSVFIEPQATLAVVHTEIDDADIFGSAVEFDDETSIRGRLGLRLGFEHANANQVVYSGDVTASAWEEFSGDNNVTITDPVLGSFDASDDPGSTLGDVSVGLSALSPEGWSGFLRANYLFGEDYEAITGNAGVRWAW